MFLQNVFITYAGVASVGGEDGLVKFLVGQVDPGGAFVVEIGQRPFLKLLGTLFVFGDDARIADGADAGI